MTKGMGVSKNRGTPKWMVEIMENPIQMDDLGVPLFLETPIWTLLGIWPPSEVVLVFSLGIKGSNGR